MERRARSPPAAIRGDLRGQLQLSEQDVPAAHAAGGADDDRRGARARRADDCLRVRTLAEIERSATARWRFRAQLVGAFAALALTVALVGVFGVLAYSVQQRTREFGVRMALGARRADVLNLVFSGAARVVGIGAIVGLAAAALLTRSIATLLFAVTPLDPLTFAAATALLALTAAAATAGPAWRASRVDPVVSFRND